jgi:hypothetical protein
MNSEKKSHKNGLWGWVWWFIPVILRRQRSGGSLFKANPGKN